MKHQILWNGHLVHIHMVQIMGNTPFVSPYVVYLPNDSSPAGWHPEVEVARVHLVPGGVGDP